jgi:hypothetical protein
MSLEALMNSQCIAFESPGIKEHMYNISKPYLLPFLRNRWFIFNEQTVHLTRSPVGHCPISKRKIFQDSVQETELFLLRPVPEKSET